MTLSLIVAMTDGRVIGKNNQLPWHLSEDLKRFKKITMGHPIVMGRKTFESIGKPLPGRENVVLTRDKNFKADGVSIAHDLKEALRPDAFVIGGAHVFEAALPHITRIYLTLIHHSFQGDVYFPPFDLEKDFRVIDKADHRFEGAPSFDYTFITADRI